MKETDSSSRLLNRRQFLTTTVGGSVMALAGCSGSDEEEGSAEAEESSDESGSSEEENSSQGENQSEGNEASSEEVLENEDQESAVEGLEILEHELVEEDYSVSVEGVVRNNTGEELSYVEVGVILFNADGQRIGDSFTNTTDLPDGQEWAFEVHITEDAEDIDDYTIAVTDSPF